MYGIRREELEAAGEAAVRADLSKGKYGDASDPRHIYVSACLEGMEIERAEAAAARKETREKESLSISRKALRNSTIATIIAITAIIVAAREPISSTVIWLFSR